MYANQTLILASIDLLTSYLLLVVVALSWIHSGAFGVTSSSLPFQLEILSEISVMRAGRKNLRWAVNEREVTLSEGQNIVRTISVRGSNIIEVVLVPITKAHG